jgi:hypothetical protein
MVTPIVTEIRQPPADAGQDTFIADLGRSGARNPTPKIGASS